MIEDVNVCLSPSGAVAVCRQRFVRLLVFRVGGLKRIQSPALQVRGHD